MHHFHRKLNVISLWGHTQEVTRPIVHRAMATLNGRMGHSGASQRTPQIRTARIRTQTFSPCFSAIVLLSLSFSELAEVFVVVVVAVVFLRNDGRGDYEWVVVLVVAVGRGFCRGDNTAIKKQSCLDGEGLWTIHDQAGREMTVRQGVEKVKKKKKEISKKKHSTCIKEKHTYKNMWNKQQTNKHTQTLKSCIAQHHWALDALFKKNK